MNTYKAFQSLHNQYLAINPIVHAYAEPNGNAKKTDPSSLWFLYISNEKNLVDNGFKDYIHPEGDFNNGYWDHCSIEKGTFDYDNMREGEVFPTILYAHHETILTVSCVVKTSEYPDVVTGEDKLALYVYYPHKGNLEEFEKHKEALMTYKKYSKQKAAIDDRYLFDESYTPEQYDKDDNDLLNKLENI